MKNVLITLIAFYILLTIGGGWIGIPMFKVILGGGVREEYLYPLYWGMMLLAGLIVICTQLIIEHIKELK